jgi:DNA-binding NtrC family response regulator
MHEILLCSHNPILKKSLYGMLRDEGYEVETADHPANAVQMVLNKHFNALIIEPEPFGISAEDAVKIIKSVLPEMVVIFVGYDKLDPYALALKAPVDLEEFRRAIHEVRNHTALQI